MTRTVDFKRPHRKLGPDPDPEYILQDGIIFNWSESNIRFEPAWWLTGDGDPILEDPSHPTYEHVQNLLKQRPFDKAWLA